MILFITRIGRLLNGSGRSSGVVLVVLIAIISACAQNRQHKQHGEKTFHQRNLPIFSTEPSYHRSVDKKRQSYEHFVYIEKIPMLVSAWGEETEKITF